MVNLTLALKLVLCYPLITARNVKITYCKKTTVPTIKQLHDNVIITLHLEKIQYDLDDKLAKFYRRIEFFARIEKALTESYK